jgi:DNA repair exonuclease SbcCD ATPase subunit
MIIIKNIAIKNFMSVGNVTQSINFVDKDLVLVLGENLDMGGNDSRNGVGKSTIVNALSYALYGSALTNIRKDNLINKTNAKNMVVTLEFEIDGIEYLVERGRRPNKFSFMVAGLNSDVDDADEAQGDSRITQQQLERELGLSHNMFKNIVALNTYSEPFLAMKAADQRELIEQLLGITKLSEKAEVLKERLKETKDAIKEEEFRIDAVKGTNKRIENNVESLRIKKAAWDANQTKLIADTQAAIGVLEGIDIDAEIENHKVLAVIKDTQAEKDKIDHTCKTKKTQLTEGTRRLQKAYDDLVVLEGQACHTCGQDLHDDAHETLQAEVVVRIDKYEGETAKLTTDVAKLEGETAKLIIDDSPETFYSDLESAYDHRASLETLQTTLEVESARENYFVEQIESLEKTGIQVIDYTGMNELTVLGDHQDFLLKLLTSKDSFIRRKIINQNLTYLNARLEHYLDLTGLPHKVKFQSDLNVEIREHGRDLDFDNLSRGERTRLILGLSWSFRDVYESLNSAINLLFIDELIDNGLDPSGVESSLAVLKHMTRESGRNIFLISHKDELVGRVSSVLKVVKEGGFTAFENDVDIG